jgi:hypothetical protein
MKVTGLPGKFVPIYNEFVDTCNENNLTFDSININVGESKEGVEGLIFEMNLPFGLEQEKADLVFKTFNKNHPECYLTFNVPEQSTLETILRNTSETVIGVHQGFRLEKI